MSEIEIVNSTVVLHLLGCDLLDGTPIFDIKPYLPYVDSISDAKGGFADTEPEKIAEVILNEQSQIQCEQASERLNEDIESIVMQILGFDPRPSYQQKNSNNERIYSMKLYDFDLKWQYCENNKIKVLGIIQNQ